jgi:hypothetical protein
MNKNHKEIERKGEAAHTQAFIGTFSLNNKIEFGKMDWWRSLSF